MLRLGLMRLAPTETAFISHNSNKLQILCAQPRLKLQHIDQVLMLQPRPALHPTAVG
jgi:hypothetical protein